MLEINQKQDSLWPDYPNVFSNLKGINHFPKTINVERDKRNELKKAFTDAYTVIHRELFKYQFSEDNLQDTMLYILNRLDTLEIEESAYNYLLKACIYRFRETLKTNTRHNLFKDKIGKKIEDSDNGITDEFIRMLLDEIKAILKNDEYAIFIMYHVKGYNQTDIGNELHIDQKTISNRLRKINDKIDRLNINYLYDNRYVDYTNKSKHNHISSNERKALARELDKEYKGQFDGIAFKVLPENYAPMVNNPVTIPANKALQYPTKKWYEFKRNDFGIVNESQDEYDHVSNLAYLNSVLPIPDKPGYSAKEYRRKKYFRIYQRSIRSGIAKQDIVELFKGHKSYLGSDGIAG